MKLNASLGGLLLFPKKSPLSYFSGEREIHPSCSL